MDLQLQTALVSCALFIGTVEMIAASVHLFQHPVGFADDLIEHDRKHIPLQTEPGVTPELPGECQIILSFLDFRIKMCPLFLQIHIFPG